MVHPALFSVKAEHAWCYGVTQGTILNSFAIMNIIHSEQILVKRIKDNPVSFKNNK